MQYSTSALTLAREVVGLARFDQSAITSSLCNYMIETSNPFYLLGDEGGGRKSITLKETFKQNCFYGFINRYEVSETYFFEYINAHEINED